MKVKQKLKTLIASALCMAMAISPVSVLAETVDAGAGNTSILAENFDELKARSEELAREHEAGAQSTEDGSPVGAIARSYAAARSAYSFDIDLSVGKAISYNGYMTHDFELSDGTKAFCLEPSKMNPSSGGYTATESGDSLLRAVAYYGFGGPGYEDEMGMYNLLDSAVRPYAYVLTHMALSYVYDGCSDDTDAFKGTNAGTVEGIKQMVSTINNFAWMVPSGYGVFTFGGGSTQVMGFGGYYRPQAGKLKLQKVSANPSITDGNSCYSLAGAEYGVYSDEACTNQVITLITDAAGNSSEVEVDAGNYWVKEIKAPKGFALDPTTYPVTVTSGQTATVQAADEPTNDPLSIILQKVDKDTGEAAQGTASLAGAQFTVKYYDGYYDQTNLPAQATRTWVIETKERTNPVTGQPYYRTSLTEEYKVLGDDFYYMDGNPDPVIPLGTITIEETKAPEGYLLEGAYLQAAGSEEKITGLYVAQIQQIGDLARLTGGNTFTMSDSAIHGGVRIQKRDAETGDTTAQGSAVLSGGEYAIINRSILPVFVGGNLYATGETVMTIVTNADGVAQTAADALPHGDYKAKETKAPEGYQLSGVIEQDFSITENGVIVDLTDKAHSFQDPVIRGGVMIQKRDYETGAATPMGGATLEGAEIEIYNRSKLPVLVGGKLYATGDYIMTITTNRVGLAQTAADALPYGDYHAKETKAPAGCLLSGVLEQDFSIRENGKMVDLTDKEHSIQDQVKRGDFELRKIDSKTQDSMGGVEFEVTQIVTGECHRFTTDENGYYSSENRWNAHSSNTNGGGAEDGLWFGQTTGGEMAPVDDTLGAMPWGDYAIDELEGPNNVGKEMFHGVLHIRRDKVTIDLGNIENDGEEPKITISTQARDAVTGTQIAQAGKELTIIDEVTLTGVIPGREYTMSGILMDKETGKALLVDDKEVIAEKTFTADSTVCVEELTFTCDGSSLAGKSIVVFEKCYYRGREVAAHEDIKDEAQTVYIPKIETELTDAVTGSHLAEAAKEMTLTDAVPYFGLKPGVEYTMFGILMDQDTNAPLLIDGKEVTAKQTFTPEKTDGVVKLTFTFDGSTLAGKSVVAFEDCLFEGRNIAVHHDINSEEQTVHIPEIKTELTDVVTGSHTAQASGEMILKDAVPYYNLIPGKEYVMSGILMDQDTNAPLLIDGKEVTAEQTFIPENADGVVELTFIFDGSTLAGKSVVAFEDCLYEGKKIAVHHDINSEEQTVHIPKIETELTDVVTGSHMAEASSEMTLTDAVPYFNLIPGKEYTMSGILMDKDINAPLLINGKEVTAEQTFIPENADGVVELIFTFDGSALAGKSVVAFEDCLYEGKKIAVHHDIDSEEQTVNIPKIETELTDVVTGSHTAEASSEMTLKDAVPYFNLIPGKEYIMSGILMDKETGEPLLVGGKTVTAEQTFTPEKADGVVELTFTFDGSALGGKSVVAFETCFYEGKEIAVHHDIDAPEQTVDIVNQPVPPVVKPKTGDKTPLMAMGILCLCGAGLVAASLIRRKLRRK